MLSVEVSEKFINEAKRVEEDCTLSFKRHFNSSQSWDRTHYLIGLPSVALAAIAGATGLTELEYGSVIAGVLSIFVAILTAINTFINPLQRAEHHHKMGNRFLALRNKARIYHQISIPLCDNHKDALKLLRELTEERDQLNELALQTTKKSFKLAQEGVRQGEASYQIDEK